MPQFGGEVMQRRPPTRSARRYRLVRPLRRWLSAAMPHPLSTMSIVSSSVTSIARTNGGGAKVANAVADRFGDDGFGVIRQLPTDDVDGPGDQHAGRDVAVCRSSIVRVSLAVIPGRWGRAIEPCRYHGWGS